MVRVDDRVRWVQLLADGVSDAEDPPQRICDLCVEHLGVTGAGVSIVSTAGNRGVVCSTDDVSARVEDLQFTLGEGPCIDAVGSGAPVLVGDLTDPSEIATDRWPAFLKGAAEAGVRAVFAFPLLIGAISIGAMDLYRDEPGDLSDSELPAALLAADAAALALLHASKDAAQRPASALDGRAMYDVRVHQATGMVQMQLGVNTEAALLSLRARAFSTGKPLLELADDVVQRRVRFSLEDR